MAEPESSILIHSTSKIPVRNSYKIDAVTLWPLMTTYKDYRLALQTNTNLISVLWSHSCPPRKTSQKVTHLKITPHQARLTMECLANGSHEEKLHLVDMSSISIQF